MADKLIDMKDMIKYQTLDMKLYTMNKEYNDNPNKKKFDEARDKINKIQSKLNDNEAEAESLAAEIERIHAEYKKTLEEIATLEKALEESDNAETKAEKLPYVEVLMKRVEGQKHKIQSRIKKITQLTGECKKSLVERQEIKEKEYDKAKAILEPYVNEIKKDKSAIDEQLNELRDKVSPELMSEYIKRRKEGIVPVYVEVVGEKEDSLSCPICGMQLSTTSRGLLKKDKMCQCESCRRIVYSKQ